MLTKTQHNLLQQNDLSFGTFPKCVFLTQQTAAKKVENLQRKSLLNLLDFSLFSGSIYTLKKNQKTMKNRVN
jgi:hypothetical protein